MGTIEAIRERRSIRKFTAEKVSHEVITDIVAEAAYAPSWKNTQISRYVIVEDEAVKRKIAEECVIGFSYNTKTIMNAPVLVVQTVVCGRSGYEKDGSYTTSKEDRWESYDAGIAAQTFCLAAHAKGLGTVIMGIFDEEKVAEAIHLTPGQKVAALIPLGYPEGEAPAAPKRKEAEDLVSFI